MKRGKNTNKQLQNGETWRKALQEAIAQLLNAETKYEKFY